MTNYNNFPKIKISDNNVVIKEYQNIAQTLAEYDKIAIECYPGTDYDKLNDLLLNEFPDHKIIFIDEYTIDNIQKLIEKNITDDRVFGYMSNHYISDFYSKEVINKLQTVINETNKVIIYGFGASLIRTQVLVMADLARWEIQLRLRKGLSNWKADNANEDMLRKFKRGYFFEWRVADRVKKANFENFNYFLDLNDINKPKLIAANYVREGLVKACNMPFRLVPYFDSGVWGGQWMKEQCNLDSSKENYAWSFDGVPEENSILLEFGNDYIELPAMNLVKYAPKNLLGVIPYARFGDEFPIRFDFLDTIGGQNLSLQVHPLTEYIQENFGMNYTQDESYYILDCNPDEEPVVYIGLKNNVDKDVMFADLRSAESGKTKFDTEKYINKIPVKKHDHVAIPAGTVHCSGAGTMVLEISATPYIFTFKLWDWDRLGMDGKPRPVHIDHGEKVIQMDRDTNFVMNELFNNIKVISNEEESTGLHDAEFIETRRITTKKNITHQTDKRFHMLNLIAGSAAIISSPNNEFEDYEVHYAETFIIPAGVAEYSIKPKNNDEEIMYIKAYVRG